MNEEQKDQSRAATENSHASGVIIILVAIMLVVGVGIIYFKNQMAVNHDGNNQSGNIANESAAKVFNLTAVSYKFSLAEIRVKKGDRIRVNLTVADGLHDWVIDEFNVRTNRLASGQSDSVEFIASRAGTFEYYCSVGNHRQMGMVGKLIVEE